jgi:hypothetical protein
MPTLMSREGVGACEYLDRDWLPFWNSRQNKVTEKINSSKKESCDATRNRKQEKKDDVFNSLFVVFVASFPCCIQRISWLTLLLGAASSLHWWSGSLIFGSTMYSTRATYNVKRPISSKRLHRVLLHPGG